VATIAMILLRIYRPNFVRFLRQRSPKGEAAAWSAYSWIRACTLPHTKQKKRIKSMQCNTKQSRTSKAKTKKGQRA